MIYRLKEKKINSRIYKMYVGNLIYGYDFKVNFGYVY